MSQPTPNPVPSSPSKSTRREALFAIVCGVGVLGFLVYGVATMGSRQQAATSNTLTGTVVGKKFTPQEEEQVSFGSRGTSSEKVKGDYVLEVHVKQENRTFEVPVTEATYDAMRVGATFSFMRPRSEQIR